MDKISTIKSKIKHPILDKLRTSYFRKMLPLTKVTIVIIK